jgi:endogenous inhibitor of DNA gyrase (YacG/DUF329 family)
MAACPICKRTVERPQRSEKGAFPFCSPRCKQVDLGQWLEESYRIAGDPRDASDLDERTEEA